MKVLRSILGWGTLATVGVSALLLMFLAPGLERRRRIARFTAKAVLAAAGVRLSVTLHGRSISQGMDWYEAVDRTLPSNCVVVANHTSYLDGLILTAALPPRFGFVIKKEMSRVPLAGQLLRRIGSEFVERFDRQRSAMDARRMLRRASEGRALVFFPEGTFSKQTHMLRFHTGAFVTAARAGCPVVPCAIHGARRTLPHDSLLISPGSITVEILQPLLAESDDKQAVARLRDRAWQAIAERFAPPLHIPPVLPANLVERT